MKFSANLGFLWQELALPEAIRAAKRAGFDAVECHWPYEEDPAGVVAALKETELTMQGINTLRGDVEQGDNGLCALVGREDEARTAIELAVHYAALIGAKNVHVMAGKASGTEAFETFVGNLRYAAELAAQKNVGLLIEPLNPHDAPDYFLADLELAAKVIEAVGSDRLKLMFDFYHVERITGDAMAQWHKYLPLIGHVQIAGVPDRGRPDAGDLDYLQVMKNLAAQGYDGPIGAEYLPCGETEATLSWLPEFQTIS